MMFNQTDEPYVRNQRMVRPERFLEYFRYLSRLYRSGLVGSTSQVSMEWSEDYRNEAYIMAPWSLWISQYEAFSVNEKEDWVLISPPGGSFKWGGMVCCIPSSSTHKEAAWDFVRYLTHTEEGAAANREAKCRQLIDRSSGCFCPWHVRPWSPWPFSRLSIPGTTISGRWP